VEGLLPDPYRRVRPDRIEGEVGRHVVRVKGDEWGEGVDLSHSLGVTFREIERASIDVDGPHSGIGAEEPHRQGDRPPSASEVEEVSSRRSRDVI